MSAVEITVGDDGKPDGFSLDLRGYEEPRRRRARGGRRSYTIANPYESNGDPLSHWYLTIAGCAGLGDDDTAACREAAWADHLARCTSCRRAELFVRLRAFAREHHDELETIREERAALLEWARQKLARSGS